MKKLQLFLTVLLISFTSAAQGSDPQLFRTWYLINVAESDDDVIREVAEIEPPITPNITISENLEIYGNGACNTFNGTYELLGDNSLNPLSFDHTTETCNFQSHNFFESSFFGFMSGEFWYHISSNDQGLTLSLNNPIFGFANFQDYPLSISESNLVRFKISPNPVSEILYITSENNSIDKISVYSINGQLILSENENTHQLDVSALSKGLYFVEVTSENGVAIQKFIKQ